LTDFRQLADLLRCQFDLILWFQARHLNTPFGFAIRSGMLLPRLTRTQPSTYFWCAVHSTVSRRPQGAKTDRGDVEQLLRLLIRYQGGERRVWSAVHVPSVEEEDARRLHRELEWLKKECTGHRNRLQALLVAQGLRLQPSHDLLERLENARRWDGAPLPPDLREELRREEERLQLVTSRSGLWKPSRRNG
jgi:transposase